MAKPLLRLAETKDFSQSVLAMLSAHFEVDQGPVDEKVLSQVLQQCDVFWFRLGYKLNRDVLAANQRCRVLVSPVTGLDHIDERLCEKYGIRIVALRGETKFLQNIRATTEHTILLTLALMRKIVPAVCDVQEGNWERDKYRGFELYEKSIGIVGLGRLGKIVTDYFLSFGCRVFYYDTDASLVAPLNVEKCDSLIELIEVAHIVSIHVPYNHDNHHLFNKEVLSHFTNHKYLINTSRGGVIDESALLDVLLTGKIGGAALDVLEGEPDIKNSSIVRYARQNNNLIISPHIGGNTFESFAKTEAFLANKIIKLFQQTETY